MPKTLKKNHSKSTSYKKVKIFQEDFPISGNFTLCEGRTKNMKNLETVFHLPGDLSHVEGDKMKKFNFFEEIFRLLGFLPYEGRKRGKN